MSTLAILIPPRPRLPARPADDAARATEFDYVQSHDGRSVAGTGRATAALLPKAGNVVAVLADADVAWHRVTLPKAPPARLRAALGGLLEEALLDDDAALHLALPPKAPAGQPTWVAAVDKAWLAATLAALEGAGVEVGRVVPASVPGGEPAGHFFTALGDGPPERALSLVLAGAEGVATLRLAGTLARALLPAAGSGLACTATPAAAAAAEHWLGAPVALRGEAERALQALATPWNLRQFDLAPKHRGTRALREGLRRFLSPEWRGLRRAAIALVVIQLVGLNLAAWRARQALDAKRAEMAAVLKASHPGVRLVYDAPVQMQRETERLRAAAGKPGEGDLETLLAAAAAAWPDGQGPVQTLRFENGRLVLGAPGWGEPQLAQFRDRLRPGGLAAEMSEGRVTVTRPKRGVA